MPEKGKTRIPGKWEPAYAGRGPADARRSPDERGQAVDGVGGQGDASHAGGGNSRAVPLACRIPGSARHRLGSEYGRFGKPILLVDKALEGRTNLIGGANKEDYHVKHLTPGKNFHPTAYVDLRSVAAGEDCPNCGAALRCASIPRSRSDTFSSSATSIRSRWVRVCSTATARKSLRLWGATGSASSAS